MGFQGGCGKPMLLTVLISSVLLVIVASHKQVSIHIPNDEISNQIIRKMQASNPASDPLNCGSHSEDGSDAEFAPCPSSADTNESHQKKLDIPVTPPLSQLDNIGDIIILIEDPESIFEPSDTKLSCSRKEGVKIDAKIYGTVLNFAYTIETSTDKINPSIVNDLEKAVLSSLDDFILDCSSSFLENGTTRKLLSEDNSSNGLVSVDSNPSDEILEESCIAQHADAVACHVIEGRMALYFASDNVNMIMDVKQDLLKSILLSMADGELLSADMPFVLRVSYLRPDVTEEIRKPRSDQTEGEDTMNTGIIVASSTFFVAVFAYAVRAKVLSRQPAESNASNHDQSINDDSVLVDSEQV